MAYVLIAATAMLALISVSVAAADSGVAETTPPVCADPKTLSADAVYIGGATIIALAAFGSVLSTGVITGKDKKIERFGAMLVFGGAAIVVFIQGINMLHVCCLNFDVSNLWHPTIFTIAGSILIIIGFGWIMDKRFMFSSKDRDKGQGTTSNAG